MQKVRFTQLFIFFFMIVLAVMSSCQKDPDLKSTNSENTNLSADSADVNSMTSSGNYLAISGTLTVKFKDSTYAFDASRDSIAFVNVQVADSNRYFGITAINKDHTISFGVSSAGLISDNSSNAIAGSQLLLKPDENKTGLQYSLSRYTSQKDVGTIKVVQYNHGNELVKGTFSAFLAKDDKLGTPFYKVEGSFDLHLK